MTVGNNYFVPIYQAGLSNEIKHTLCTPRDPEGEAGGFECGLASAWRPLATPMWLGKYESPMRPGSVITHDDMFDVEPSGINTTHGEPDNFPLDGPLLAYVVAWRDKPKELPDCHARQALMDIDQFASFGVSYDLKAPEHARIDANIVMSICDLSGGHEDAVGMTLDHWAEHFYIGMWVYKFIHWVGSEHTHDAHVWAAKAALIHCKEDLEEQGRIEAEQLLSLEICNFWRQRLGVIADGVEEEEPLAWMKELEAKTVSAIRNLGEKGRQFAGSCEDALKVDESNLELKDYERWKRWFKFEQFALFSAVGEKDHLISPMLKLTAVALWSDVVKPRWLRKQEHRPALARGVMQERLIPLMSGKAQIHGNARHIVSEQGVVIAELAPTITTHTARELLPRFSQVHAHRLITKLAWTAHEQKEDEVSDYRKVSFDGGFKGLKDAIKYSDKSNSAMKELLQMGQYLELENSQVRVGGLWTWSEIKAAPGRKARLDIVVGDLLLPNYNERYDGTSLNARESRRLIPLLEHEPPLDTLRGNDQGNALTLSLLAMVELRDQAERLVQRGAIVTSRQRWRELAASAGLPLSSLDGLLIEWSNPSNGGVQLLEVQGDEWTLASPHESALNFIKEAGRRSIEGRKNGKRSKTRKKST